MSLRNYNKLYVHKDREEGSQKILLGYQNNDKQLILKKNAETIFNIPYYTTTLKLANSTLIQDGATAGPFPAASDRIYKNRKDYGATTPNGMTSDIADGLWFCSWLYKDPAGKVQWMDRFYNPGSFVFDIAETQLGETTYRKYDADSKEISTYTKYNPVYRDVPSTVTLEQGVQYRYFHIGEESAQEIITTFAGSGERLRMKLNGWGTNQVDSSPYKHNLNIKTNGTPEIIYFNKTETDRVSANVINFNNSYDIAAYVEYDPSYGMLNEYTLSFWAQSDSWKESQTTQLVGNFSTKGGTGVFIDTLSSYPFFVISETGYGHLLYVNEDYEQFLDRSLHPAVSLTATPLFAAIDLDNNVIIGNADTSKLIRKLDHTGKVLAQAGVPVKSQSEQPLQLLCGQNNTVVYITNRARYYYDDTLTLINTTIWDSLSTTVAAFAYDIDTDTAELLSMNNVLDCKYIGTNRWCLSANDGNLYVKYKNTTEDVLFTEFGYLSGSTFGIDPYNRIWVMRGNNRVSVYDSTFEPKSDPVFEFVVGSNNFYERKNLSFFCEYDRATQTREWRAIIYYGDSGRNLENPQFYVVDMKGSIVRVVDILSLFDLYTVKMLKQDQVRMEFFGRGDFTGYENRRVFHNLSPYKREPQIILKTVLKNTSQSVLPYTIFRKHYSIGHWNTKSWQHFAVTLKNRLFTLYNNGVPVINIPYSGSYEMTYESQPAFFIGSPVGAQYGFNQEIGKTSAIFNGKIETVEIYDYAIEQKNLEMFQRATIPAQDINWSLPTPTIQYIETVERMFKNKIPGAKSSFFNIKLCGTNIKDANTRLLIEEAVRNIVEEIKPAYASFLEVKWVD